ncbi:MAG: hypothetical protein RR423_06350 [Hydrogenoanaerobacterium sp.]
MILYHATRKSLGDKILKAGFISCTVSREYTSPYSISINGRNANIATTNGLVYLSNSPIMAITFANATAYKANETKIYIFEIEIDEKLLLPDKDQLALESVRRNCSFPKGITAQESIKECYCAAYPFDIKFKQNKTRFLILPSTLYGEDVTLKQDQQTKSIILVTKDFFKGTGMLEENPNFLPAMEYLKSCNWIDIT